MSIWPEIKNGDWLKDILGHSDAVRYWSDIFQMVYKNEIDTWDYQWTFSCWIQNGLTIIPSVNLVSNIGFGSAAAHTKGRSRVANMAVAAMDFPLRHPPFMVRGTKADDFVQRTHFHVPNIFLRKIRRFLMKGKNISRKILKRK